MSNESTCWCLKAVNDFIPDNGLKNGYFGSDESLDVCIKNIKENYPGEIHQIKHLNETIVIDKDTKIIIEEVPF